MDFGTNPTTGSAATTHVTHANSLPPFQSNPAARRDEYPPFRAMFCGGMLIECPDFPDGATRVHMQFEIPLDQPIAEGVARKICTSATVHYRDPAAGTASLAFIEALRPQYGGDRIIDRFIL